MYELGKPDIWRYDVSFTVIREALTAQEHCLETLWLDINPFHYRGILNSYEDTTLMVSFESFQKSKIIRIRLSMFSVRK